jgi:hypothetical protein
MPERRPTTDRPKVSWYIGNVMVPFRFFDETNLNQLDLLDDEGVVWEVLTQKPITREPRPHDPFTAWVAFAYMGFIEKGGPILRPELNREQRLEVAHAVLTEEEVVVVETIAVPEHYRKLPARELEQMVRTAPDYIDRMWAGCWLELIGWTRSPECAFRPMHEMPPDRMDDLEETIVEAYARSIGVTSQADKLGWHRIDTGYEANLVSLRLTICGTHYNLNGPPPYQYTKDTIPFGPSWKQVVRLVPERRRR